MKIERFFDLVLSFGSDWSVVEVIQNPLSSEVDIYLEYCGKNKPYDFAPVRRWRHLDTMQYKSFIHARLPRFKSSDGKVTTLSPPWADKHERQTYLFESAVIDMLLATMNQSKTASFMRCSFDVVNRIMHRASKRGMERRKSSPEVLKHLSIDEKSFQKGHNYATVLSHPDSGRVLDVVHGRTKKACVELIGKALSQEQQEQVETISMDMWPSFITTAEEQLPDAEVVHDKFHLVSYLNKAIDSVRRREVKKHLELKNSRYALLKNEENLTEKQRIKFDAIRQANYEVSRAWQAREDFRDVFQNATEKESYAIFEQWFWAVQESGIQEVIKVAEMFANHIDGVVKAMTSNLTNAMAERLNGKIQLLKSNARGYRKFENFRSAILFFNGKLKLYPLKCQ